MLSASAAADWRALLAGEVRQLYQNNPFRVLNISTDATASQAQKRVQKLNVLRQTGQKVADEYAVREAMQAIRDPRRRLLAEIFWFHVESENDVSSESPWALQAMRKGRWLEARDIWMRELKTARGEPKGLRAWHNVAVLLHARVAAIEAGSNPLVKQMPGNRSLLEELIKSWQLELRAWNSYFQEERARKWWRERVQVLDDKRIDADFVLQLRAALPEILGIGFQSGVASSF